MSLKASDLVRTEAGQVGKIVLLTKDGVSAYVRIIDDVPGAHASLHRLDKLTKVGETD